MRSVAAKVLYDFLSLKVFTTYNYLIVAITYLVNNLIHQVSSQILLSRYALLCQIIVSQIHTTK